MDTFISNSEAAFLTNKKLLFIWQIRKIYFTYSIVTSFDNIRSISYYRTCSLILEYYFFDFCEEFWFLEDCRCSSSTS